MQKEIFKMRIRASAYQHIKDTAGSLPPETGGILVGTLDDFTVHEFIFDEKGASSPGAYDPDVDFLTEALTVAKGKGYSLLGGFHIHPYGCSRLSGDYGNNIGDIGYIKEFLNVNPHLDKFLTPIAYSAHEGEFTFFPYVAYRNDVENYQLVELEIIPDEKVESFSKQKETEQLELPFEKTKGSIDLQIMQNAKVVMIGSGGSNYIGDYFARTGLGELHVVDFDTVSKSNLVTQGYFIDDVGKLKVDALGERLQRINPNMKYRGYNRDFLKMTNKEIRNLIKDADLLLMMTDDFYAQALGNRVSLKYQIPAVFAIMYEKARCSEISFNIPGITPACHRCATEERYAAYQKGYVNSVTSTGSTMIHTQSLNAPISLLSLAILHRDSKDTEMGSWFGKKWDRNLIQVRTHPDFGMERTGFFRDTFSEQPRVFTFDSVWQKVEPDSSEDIEHNCLDCGGTGDLTIAAGIPLHESPPF